MRVTFTAVGEADRRASPLLTRVQPTNDPACGTGARLSSAWPHRTEKIVTPRRLRVSEQVARPASWGDQPPVDDDEARRRLLDAAEVCYERRGVSRTTVDDIAKEASVHRTTVYRYFGTRDDVLAFVLLRETADVIDSAERAAVGERVLR